MNTVWKSQVESFGSITKKVRAIQQQTLLLKVTSSNIWEISYNQHLFSHYRRWWRREQYLLHFTILILIFTSSKVKLEHTSHSANKWLPNLWWYTQVAFVRACCFHLNADFRWWVLVLEILSYWPHCTSMPPVVVKFAATDGDLFPFAFFEKNWWSQCFPEHQCYFNQACSLPPT